MLVSAGAKISGIGSSILEVTGGQKLKPVEHKIISDYYEITTFLALAAITGGKIRVHDAAPEHFTMINRVFSKFGINVRYEGSDAVIDEAQKIAVYPDDPGRPLSIKAQPWPALPVDALPLFISIALAAKNGQTLFHNWMYDAGLFWTSELTKLGANIVMCDPHRVIVLSGNKLRGATLEAPYIIRATVAMTMAAMISEGESTILNADALYRGHPHFAENLRSLGAKVEEIK
jgi:UDP-N-acetylglucosamine 1-carboxyvinyltransferase